jgi:drug/metabolite transporter (DMT)-like permease
VVRRTPSGCRMTESALSARERMALLVCWLTPLLWTANLVVARTAPDVITPHVLALGRWLLAGAILAFVTRRELWQHRHWLRANAWRYLLLGACGMWICGAWVYQAGYSTSAMNISLIYASAPVLITVGSVWWLGEHLSARQRIGVAVALTGVVHVVVRGEWSHLGDVVLVPGDLWIVAAAFSWATYALLQRRWPTVLGSTAQLAAICAGGVVVLVPFTLWEVLATDTPTLSWHGLGLVVLAAVVPGVGAYWTYGWTQKILGASRVAVTLYLGPLYAAMVTWLLLHEPLGWHHLGGAVLILSGVALVMWRRTSAQNTV